MAAYTNIWRVCAPELTFDTKLQLYKQAYVPFHLLNEKVTIVYRVMSKLLEQKTSAGRKPIFDFFYVLLSSADLDL